MRWLCGKADEKTSCWRKSLWYVFYAGLRVGIPKHESLSASPWRPYWIDLIGWNGAKDWPWPWLRFSILLSAIWRLKNVAASPFFFLISYFPRFLIGWISFFMMMTWIYSTCCILIGCWEKVSKKYQETETTIGSTWESLKEQKALHTKWWRNLGWVRLWRSPIKIWTFPSFVPPPFFVCRTDKKMQNRSSRSWRSW